MLIDEKITKKIANLAKIELSAEELLEYSNDISKILSWIDQLKKVDVQNIDPVTSVTDNKLFEREDNKYKSNIEKEDILLNAPDKSNDYFTVPKLIE